MGEPHYRYGFVPWPYAYVPTTVPDKFSTHGSSRKCDADTSAARRRRRELQRPFEIRCRGVQLDLLRRHAHQLLRSSAGTEDTGLRPRSIAPYKQQAAFLHFQCGPLRTSRRPNIPRTNGALQKNGNITGEPETVMLIASPLDKQFEGYSTEMPTSLGPEQNPFLLVPDAERISELLTPASYRTTDDGVETL